MRADGCRPDQPERLAVGEAASVDFQQAAAGVAVQAVGLPGARANRQVEVAIGVEVTPRQAGGITVKSEGRDNFGEGHLAGGIQAWYNSGFNITQ